MPGTELRVAATSDEIETIRTLFHEYQADIGVDLCFQSFAAELATLPGRYGPPRGRLYLATHDGAIAGCGALRPLEPGAATPERAVAVGERDAEMKRLFVRPAYRGHGIARILAEQLVADARGLGYDRMLLDTLATMTAARRLYGSLGFVETGAYTHNPFETAVYMELALR